MIYLLDTHALLWWWTNDPALSAKAKALIEDTSNTLLISAASAWEIATKHRLGKLPVAELAIARYNELILADGFQHLPITHLHALRAARYDGEHRDPFDRMLAAQSELETVPLITRDGLFSQFGTQVVW